MLRTTLAFLLVAGVVSADDSPLVALAKRTNRGASKSKVITNETVATSKGRISQGSVPARMPTLRPTQTAATTTRKAAPAQTATASSTYTGTVRNIEPASSAQNVTPQSSARTIEPSAGARTISPQSSATVSAPSTSAQNIQPQATNTPKEPPQQ